MKQSVQIFLGSVLSVSMACAAVAKDHKSGDSPGNSGNNGNGVSGSPGNQGNGKGNGNAGGKKAKPDEVAIVREGSITPWSGRCFTDGRTTLIFDNVAYTVQVDSRGLPELYYDGCLDWLKRIRYLDANGVKK